MQNKGFPSEWLYQLKQKNNIVSIIGKYVHLEKKGSKYWACCPFHNEKTPSFSVNEDEGFYYCFGCKESGDVISFVMKYESCDFLDAIHMLAKNANMEVPEFTGERDVVEKKQEKERVLKLLDLTYKHYQQNLYLKEAKPAQDYIKLRGFTRHELEDFKLGYSLDRHEIINYLRKQGFTYKEMLDAGVAQHKDNNYYDVLGGRLVFPIFNLLNECVGFSARALGKVEYAKYINTAETCVFHKGRVVFGINLVKALKQQGKLDKIIIVEGQIDVIAMHRAGFKSTVACMGTALTVENAKELKKLTNNIILCFDGDGAGVKATIKSIDILKAEGFNVRIASLPNIPGEHDPDEVIKKRGKEGIEKIINDALPITDYLIKTELKNYDLSKADERGKFASAALVHISKIGKNSEEEPYLDKIRDLTSIPIDILRRDLDKIKQGQVVKKNEIKEEENVLISRENGNIRAIKFILSSLMFKKDYVNKNIDYKKLLPKYRDIIDKAEQGIPISSYYDYFDVENMPVLKDCINIDFSEFESSGKQYFNECLWIIAKQELINRQDEFAEKYKLCSDIKERIEIAQKLNSIAKELREKSLEEFYVR